MEIDWKEAITILEKNRDWKGAIQLLQNSEKNDLDLYLRVMFLLAFYLAEGQYSSDDYIRISNSLKDVYSKASIKFSENSQFLFFTSIIMYIGEWYFGIDDIEIVDQMLKKVSEIERDNVLYKWGYYTRIDQRLDINTELKLKLSEQLLFNEPVYINLLKTKGLLGEYIIGTLEATYKDLKSTKSSD
jgi:hypothetical protein